jgi:hypothetical protein
VAVVYSALGLPNAFVDVGFGGFPLLDVTPWVRSVQITRGVSRSDGISARAEAGTCTVVLANLDARFDPTNLAGPYVDAGVTQVLPMLLFQVRVGVLSEYFLWRGYADGWDLSYPAGGKDAIATLSGTDLTKVLAAFDGTEQVPQGEGELPGARIERILDNALAPFTPVDDGETPLQTTTLAQNAWTEVCLVADTELGELYVGTDGFLKFRGRHAILTDARSTTSQATFGDAAGELPYVDLDLSYDDRDLANLVRISRVGGTEQVVEDATSQSQYLVHTFERSDLIHQTDTESLDYATYVLGALKEPELRFDSITIRPQRSPATLYPHVLGRDLGDRITVRLRPPGRTDVIERDCFIRGIQHTFTPESWTTVWALQDAARFTGFFILDDPVYGLLDAGNKLGY